MEKRRFYAEYVSQEKFNEFVQIRKPLAISRVPILKIEPIEYYDYDSLRCRIINHFPNSAILAGSDKWGYVSKDLFSSVTYLGDFREGKEVYFSSDGVSFFKLLNIQTPEDDRPLEFNLKMVQSIQHVEKDRSFMIMPFGDTVLNGFYQLNIKRPLKEKLEINLYRADDFTDNDIIIDTIYREIEKAEFVICEITNCNKNAFFEIGYAKAKNKELIFLLQRGIEHKFFDVAHIRRIEYDLDNPDELKAKLLDTIETIRKRR